MKAQLQHIFFLASIFTCNLVFADSPGSSTPPSPPGDGGNGALVRDNPEMALDNYYILFILALFLAFYYFTKTDFFFNKKTNS